METHNVAKTRKPLSEEQKAALVERLAKARAAKAAKKETVVEEPSTRVEASPGDEQTLAPPVQETVQNSNENTEAILARALEAIETLAKLQAAGVGNAQGSSANILNGKVTGTVTKYSIDPKNYPSPVERLKAEQRLAPFAFPLNYDLNYEVGTTSYQSKDGINFIEPKFKLELQRILRDDLTGEPTGRRLVLCRLAMHEDPQSALTVARENGIDIDSMEEQAFLNEMRYIQMRDWVFESFFHPISTNRSSQNEMVVDGKIVEFFEVNDQNSTKLPFDTLGRFRT